MSIRGNVESGLRLNGIPGDVYLLCTDGVTDQLSYERLIQLLGTNPDPAAAVEFLAGLVHQQTGKLLEIVGELGHVQALFFFVWLTSFWTVGDILAPWLTQ